MDILTLIVIMLLILAIAGVIYARTVLIIALLVLLVDLVGHPYLGRFWVK